MNPIDPATASTGAAPGVTFVMPAVNEAADIDDAISGLFEQDYDGPLEIIVAVGPSDDGTWQIVERRAATDPRVRLIANPASSTPSGLNRAIEQASHDIIVRVDAHSILPSDYTRVAVETLQATGADNVGGIMDARGRTAFERAVAGAYTSRAGLGGGAHHVGGDEGPAETVYLGVFQRDALVRVGMFDEQIRRGQDWELNQRIRAAGGVVWFSPRLTVVYRPRASWRRLVRQFASTGIWRGELARRFLRSTSLRYFVPPLLVIGLVASLVTLGVGVAASAPVAIALGAAPPLAYLALIVAIAVRFAVRDGVAAGAWSIVVLPTIHISWGVGFIAGFLRLVRDIASKSGR